MKFEFIFASLLSLSSISIASPETCRLSITGTSDRSMEEKITTNLKVAKALVDFLGINKDRIKDWTILFLHGKSPSGDLRDLQVEFSQINYALESDAIIDQNASAYVDKLRHNSVSFDPLGFGRLSFQISGTDYHHSYIMGNHTDHYGDFYLRYTPDVDVVNLSVDQSHFDAKIVTHWKNDKGNPVRRVQTLFIDKTSKPIKVTITEQLFDGIWNSDLWPTKSVILIDSLEAWDTEHFTSSQTYGL